MNGQELKPGLLGEKPTNSCQDRGKTWLLTSRQKIYCHYQKQTTILRWSSLYPSELCLLR